MTRKDPLFALPDILDEEKGPYADFINHISKMRVKLLNDMIEFDQDLTLDELEDAFREQQNNDFMEGRCTHLFNEVCDILEYVPHGYELGLDEAETTSDSEDSYEDIEDIDESNEKIEEDETMRWGDEEESQPAEELEAAT